MHATVGCAPLDKISCTMRLLRLPHAGSQIYHLFFRQFQKQNLGSAQQVRIRQYRRRGAPASQGRHLPSLSMCRQWRWRGDPICMLSKNFQTNHQLDVD